jgi:hypothetical protein
MDEMPLVGTAHESLYCRNCRALAFAHPTELCNPHFFSGSSISLKRASWAHSSVTVK